MERKILFRGKSTDTGEWLYGDLCHGLNDEMYIRHVVETGFFAKEAKVTMVDKKTIGQFTGVFDKNGEKLFEGSKFLFWICYPTTQTHTGDNIPGGSYTEPDETQFLRLEAEVIWDEDSAKFTFSLLSKNSYQFSQYFNFGWYDNDNLLPIIERTSYSLEYIKEYYGYEGMSNEEWQELLSDVGFSSEQDMMNEVNKIEIIGNIHDVKEQLVKAAQ